MHPITSFTILYSIFTCIHKYNDKKCMTLKVISALVISKDFCPIETFQALGKM